MTAKDTTGAAKAGKNRNGIQVIDRAAALISHLEANPDPCTLSSLARGTGLSASTVHRILGSLLAAGFVKQTIDGRWSLGLRLLELGNLVYERFKVRERALPHMQTLHRQTGMTVNLSIRDGDRLLYIEHVLSPENQDRQLRRIGTWAPLHITSGGKLFLARMLPDELRAYAQRTGLTAGTQHSISSMDTLLMTLTRVRETGWAYDREEYETNVHCVAVPIMGPGNKIAAALSLAAPSDVELTPAVIASLAGAAQMVSAAMGARAVSRTAGRGYGNL